MDNAVIYARFSSAKQQDRRLAINENEAEIVRRAFRMIGLVKEVVKTLS